MEISSSDESADAIFLVVIQIDVSQNTVCYVERLTDDSTELIRCNLLREVAILL